MDYLAYDGRRQLDHHNSSVTHANFTQTAFKKPDPKDGSAQLYQNKPSNNNNNNNNMFSRGQ